MRRRSKAKWEPRCFHCHEILSDPNTAWRAPLRDQETGDWAFGAGVIICGPSCPELPADEVTFRRRPSVSAWVKETPQRQREILAGYDL